MSEYDRPAEQPAVKTTIVGGRPPGPGKPVGPIPRGIEVLVKKAAVDPAFRRLLLETRDEAAREIDLALEPAEALMLRAAPREQLQAIIARTKVHPKVRSAFLGRAAAVMLVALGAGRLGCDREEVGEPAGIAPDRPPVERVWPTTGTQPDLPPEAKPPSTGETATAEKPKPATETLTVPAGWDEQDALRAFARGLKHLSAELLPKNTFTFKDGEDGQIRIAWKTQEYKVEAVVSKTGRKELVDVTGPAADGLILTVWINKEPDQAVRPQTLDRDGHWKTDLKQVQLLPLETNLKFNLDYGAETKKNLLTTFSSPQVWYQFHTSPDPSEAVTRGVRPDRPPTGKGIRPDRP